MQLSHSASAAAAELVHAQAIFGQGATSRVPCPRAPHGNARRDTWPPHSQTPMLPQHLRVRAERVLSLPFHFVKEHSNIRIFYLF